MIVVTEPSFDFVINAAGGIMLVVLARASAAKKPFLVYDRRRTMALFRDEGEVVRLTHIPRQARRAVLVAREIEVAELDAESRPVRSYRAKVVLDGALARKLAKEARLLW